MTYEDWYSTLPYASMNTQRADLRRYASPEFQQSLKDIYSSFSTPDSSGNLPWGTNGLGVLPGQQAEDVPAIDQPTFYGGRDLFTQNGKQYARVGEDLRQTFAQHPKEVQDFLRKSGVPQDQWSIYDPANGYGVPADLYAGMGQVAEKVNTANEKWYQKLAEKAPIILGSVGMGAALGGALPALDAAGESIANPGILGQLGYSNPLSGVPNVPTSGLPTNTPPESYWSMLADASGNNAAAAGTVGGAALTPTGGVGSALGGAFDAAGLGTGVDAGTLASTAGLGAGVTGAVFPSIAGGAGAGGNLLGSIGGLSGLGLIASGLGGIAQAVGANRAANVAAGAANRASDTQLGMFNTINNQQAPYRQAGYSALGSIQGGLGLGPASGGVGPGQFTHQFDAQDLHTNLAPNYEFMRDQGLGAVRNQMNKTGGQYSGNTLKAINDYAMNFADNSYQNAFNNYNSNQTNIFNRLSNIAGLGQTANQTTANAGTTAAGNAGNAMIAGGQAQAAGNIGVANALTNAGNNAMGWYALPQLLAFSGSANG